MAKQHYILQFCDPHIYIYMNWRPQVGDERKKLMFAVGKFFPCPWCHFSFEDRDSFDVEIRLLLHSICLWYYVASGMTIKATMAATPSSNNIYIYQDGYWYVQCNAKWPCNHCSMSHPSLVVWNGILINTQILASRENIISAIEICVWLMHLLRRSKNWTYCRISEVITDVSTVPTVVNCLQVIF